MERVARVRVAGPLAPYAEGFRGELQRLGYTPLSAVVHMRLVARLSRWLAADGLEASALTTAMVEAFFAERRAAGYVNSRTSRSVAPLVGYLQRLGVAPPTAAPAPVTPTELLLDRYQRYLRVERGLASTTAALNVGLVRPFLAGRAQACGGQRELDALTAREVSAFVVAACQRRPWSGPRLVTALRSLLRFLHVEGTIGQPLAAAVPSAAGWSRSGLPQALDAGQVAALLASCDQRSGTGRRDLAILTLLARLGLRAGEVAALGLDDINWHAGEIAVRGKGHRLDTLPLPADVGQVIVGYLTDGRPAAAQDRTVFLRAQAPYRALSSVGVVQVVVSAGRRAGLGPVGAHRLRHSAATAILRAGGSLTEVGQTLRHARPYTSAIYAKVDLPALRALARRWPGGAA